MINIWKGRKYLKLEKCRSPWYTTKSGRDICLKHYFTLWGWSLALRMVKTGYKDGILLEAEFMFGHVTDKLAKNFKSTSFEELTLSGKELRKDYPTMYCYNEDGDLLGSLDDLAWMFQYKCIADPVLRGVSYSRLEKGYIGYSHRAKQIFRVGDRLFDPKYIPNKDDYEEWEWAGFIQDQKNAQARNFKEGWSDRVSLEEVIPFQRRGSVTIKNQKEARKAAHNFAKDVS